MIEGPSGLRHLGGAGGAPVYEVSRRRLVWPNGAEAFAFSAEDPDSLRGPQFDAAWCDELGAWAKGEAVWDNLQMGLRLGAFPRCVATTTPRPVDPPATSGPRADACGIIAAGVAEAAGFGRRCFVLGDASAAGLRPADWAGRAVSLAEAVGASMIIAEANQGGEMVRQTLESAGCRLPVRLVHARLGKRARAMPVALLYEQGKVAHLGLLATLEDQMCRFGAEGFTGSPDRVDALVWAVWALMLERTGGPRVRAL
tara:strand:+ start:165965 stop:166732 length:768 start_codon:yes stop_codon:yes gene_type:complete